MFQFESTEVDRQIEPMKFDKVTMKKEHILEENKTSEQEERLDNSNGEIIYGPLESDIKLEPEQFADSLIAVSINDEVQDSSSNARRERKIPSLNHKGPYTCDICGAIYGVRKSIYQHIRYQHLIVPYLFCDHCPMSFKIKSDLASHMRCHLKFKALVCDVCGFETNIKKVLGTHKMTHGKKTHCPICHRLVTQMKRHFIDTHKKIPCKICKKVMNNGNLRIHMRIVHGPQNRNRCEQCSEAFGTKLELKRHALRAHFVGSVFECHCGGVFKTIRNLKTHKIKYHKSDVNICKVCARTYKSFETLSSHWNQKHAETHGRFMMSKFYSTKTAN